MSDGDSNAETAVLPVGSDLENAYTNKGPRTRHPSAREGVAALPYAENSKIDTHNDDGSHQNSKPSRILVRADTAVRPYAEDLSYEANSAIVRWRINY